MLNERLLGRYIAIYDENYEDPGSSSLRPINPGSVVDFNMKSFLPEEAGPKKNKSERKHCNAQIPNYSRYVRTATGETKGL